MADAYESLKSLQTMLRAHRAEHMEKMAKGLEKDDNHHEHVGRCKEAAWMIDKIGEQIKSLTGDDDAKSA
jgi:hypothetical protein